MIAKKSQVARGLLFVAGLALLAGTASAQSGMQPPLKLRGSTTVRPICQACKAAWEAQSGNWTLDIDASGTASGLLPLANLGHAENSAGNGRVEIAMASRQIKASEYCGGADNNNPPCTPGQTGYGAGSLDEWKVARDGLAVIVPKKLYDAGVTCITMQEVADIYGNAAPQKDWKDLEVCSGKPCGGSGYAYDIIPRMRETDSGTRGSFLDFLKSPYGLSESEEISRQQWTGLNRLDSNPLMLDAIGDSNEKTNPDEIGYVGIGFMNDDSRVKPVAVKAQGGSCVMPSENTVFSNNPAIYPVYPMSRWLYLYNVKESAAISGSADDPWSAQVTNYAAFIRADCGCQPTVKTEGFVKIYPDPDIGKDGKVNNLDVGKIGLSWQASGFSCGNNSHTTCGTDANCYRRDVNGDGNVNNLDVGKVGLMWQLEYTLP